MQSCFSSQTGRDGSGVSHKYNSDEYTTSKLSESDETDWKNERFQTAIKHYKRVIDKLPQDNLDLKRRVRTELGLVLFDTGNFDEAATVYEDVFNVTHSHSLLKTKLLSHFRMVEKRIGSIKPLNVLGNKAIKNKHTRDFNN